MLTELHVRDLGVIEDAVVELGPGMTALTGETGAGKTLLVHALQLALGGRASPGVVRTGAAEALVEARFESSGTGDGNEIIVARGLAAEGRSHGWIDGRMAPARSLALLGEKLLEIHGQHDQQSLLTVAGQRAALDAYAQSDLAVLAGARAALSTVRDRIAMLGGDSRARARELDLLRYQADEIAAAQICDPAEETVLVAEELRLSDVGDLRLAAAQAVNALDGGDGAYDPAGPARVDASGLIGHAISALSGRELLACWEGRLHGVLAELADVAGELRHVSETLEDDPERLDAVQRRRRLLSELRHKYGETLADVLAFEAGTRARIDVLTRQELESGELETRRADLEAAVSEAERKLQHARARAAIGLSDAVTERLHELAMPDARFEVVVGAQGAGDAVQFLLASSRGESPQPLQRVASGGELARTMLALRLVAQGGAPTMLFDEVDAGVGGSAALALARALHEVAESRQVLVVTHLAQVAAFADHQIAVRKGAAGDRAVTTIELLDGDGRIVELSRMLSGHPDSAAARAHARELIALARGAVPSTTSLHSRD